MTDEKEIEEAAKVYIEAKMHLHHGHPVVKNDYFCTFRDAAHWAIKRERERILKELRGWSYMDSYIDEIERIINNAN